MFNIEEILKKAKEAGASDVHLTVGIPPRMRVNGDLLQMDGYDRVMPPDTEQIASEIMTETQKAKLDEKGEYDMSFSIRDLGRYRLNVFHQRGSIAMAFRLVGTQVPTPEQLGIPSSIVELSQRKRGLVLVTGPTGSGKSTTLYAALGELSKPNVNVVTVEDPVEKNMDGVNQCQVNVKSGMTFSAALRSILRQDPDIVMIGEMRDSETADIAIRAAITGHLVLSTLHTNDAASTIVRLVDMGVAPYMVATSLIGVVAQRLVKVLCPRCKKPRMSNEEDNQLMHLSSSVQIYDAVGCPECNNTGYKGRTAIHEIIHCSSGISTLIAESAGKEQLENAAKKNGTKLLRDNVSELVQQGRTSIDELVRVTYSV